MNFSSFIRKWKNRVSYVRLPGGQRTVVAADSDVLPVELSDDFASITDAKIARMGPHPTFSRNLKVNERTATNWTYDLDDILSAKDHDDRFLQKFSWEPITGEFLFVPVGQQHASVTGSKPFDDYVRGIILRDQKRVTFRPFWPSWAQQSAYSVFGEDDAEASFAAQDACEGVLYRHGGKGWTFQYNINNNKLEEMTGVHRSRW